MNPRDFYLCLPQRAVWSCYLSHSLISQVFQLFTMQARCNWKNLKRNIKLIVPSPSALLSVSVHTLQTLQAYGIYSLLSQPWYFTPGEAPCLVGIQRPGLSHSETRSAITISETHFHLMVWVPALCAVLFKTSLSHRSKSFKISLHGLTKLTARHTSQGMQHLLGQEPGPGSSMDHTSPLTPAPNISPATRTHFSFLLKIIFLG